MPLINDSSAILFGWFNNKRTPLECGWQFPEPRKSSVWKRGILLYSKVQSVTARLVEGANDVCRLTELLQVARCWRSPMHDHCNIFSLPHTQAQLTRTHTAQPTMPANNARSTKKRSRRSAILDGNSDEDSNAGGAGAQGVEDVHTTQAAWKDVEAEEDDDGGLTTPTPSVSTGTAGSSMAEVAVLPEVTAGNGRASSSTAQVESTDDPLSKKLRSPPKVVPRKSGQSLARRNDSPSTPTKNAATAGTPPPATRIHPADKRTELRMSQNIVFAFVLSDMVSFVQQTGQITKLWTVVLPSGEHIVLHLEDAAHDCAALYKSLQRFAFVKLQGVSTRKTPEHNCMFPSVNGAERRLFFNTSLQPDSITDLEEKDHFEIPAIGAYNDISAATQGDTCLHETLVFVVTNAAASVHFDKYHRAISRQLQITFECGLTMDALFYGHYAKREWTFADRFELLFVLHAKQEGGRILINESSVVTTTPPHWFTGDEGDFDAVRAVPDSGVEEMVDLLEVFADPERGAGFISNLTEKSALVQPKVIIEGDVASVDDRMPTLCNGANGNYMAFKFKVSQLAPKEAEVVAFGKQAEELANTTLKDFMRMSEDDQEEVVAKIRQSTVRVRASAEWYPPTSSYQFKAKKIELL